ncbi:UDP-glucose/GDP-mannose dehydrogenase family protein [Fusobacterium sp.]|uniref:UDP-glucose dehydrogenase family protein n=1 Tax=Fusobacterium sp. TaxID=68766 RepID=UPI00262A0C14|nr:UDP-glucose/GDP-mannose dehydrogenase family protein [Fusobacterium sp.]MDY3059638.1 UDP-glucose/GDP-mannose dehydrogenase family protein [Fusobacterium sp.]MEE1475080.1 UDP-glucose/GDP-mannose dehydrogenase family protein [Fusobacterium sp.]
MRIGVVGTGYVGLVQGVIMAEFGLNVICMDISEEKINSLKNGVVPIYEPGLKELLEKNMKAERIEFTTDMKYVTENSDVIFIAVGTPPALDGSADLHFVLEVATNIGKYMNGYKVVVDKSTVPVGTGKVVRETIQKELDSRNLDYEFDIVSNPEFLREGKAVGDCLRPDRVVIGTESERAKEIMKKVYDVLFINETPFVFTNIETAEMIKYASNAFLAVKISFINEISLLAEKVGANTQEIAKAMGKDGRISPKFLHCGPGYGGSCFPKDTKAIVDIAKKYGEDMYVIKAAIDANEKQKRKMVEKIIDKMEGVEGKHIAILGLSFKPDTDDMREAPSLDIIRGLVEAGAKIQAYCPEGMKEARWRLEDCENSITYCADEYSVVNEADAVVLMTEWNQFRGMNLDKVRARMKGDFYFDLRNVYTRNTHIREEFKYFPIGQN